MGLLVVSSADVRAESVLQVKWGKQLCVPEYVCLCKTEADKQSGKSF